MSFLKRTPGESKEEAREERKVEIDKPPAPKLTEEQRPMLDWLKEEDKKMRELEARLISRFDKALSKVTEKEIDESEEPAEDEELDSEIDSDMRRKVNRTFRIASPKIVRDAMEIDAGTTIEWCETNIKQTASLNISIIVLGAHLSNSESPRDATDSVFWIAGDEMVNIKLSGVGRVNARTSQIVSVDDASSYFRLELSRLRLQEIIRTGQETLEAHLRRMKGSGRT